MHEAIEVWMPQTIDIEDEYEVTAYVEGVLDEIPGLLCCNSCGYGQYDYGVVGGQWTGDKVDSYDPTTDERNLEPCPQCNGTGDREGWVTHNEAGERTFSGEWKRSHGEPLSEEEYEKARRWAEQCNGCNGCNGTGTRVKYRLVYHPSVCSPVTEPVRYVYGGHPAAYVYDGIVVEDPEDFESEGVETPPTDGYWVTIDVHS